MGETARGQGGVVMEWHVPQGLINFLRRTVQTIWFAFTTAVTTFFSHKMLKAMTA